MSECSPLYRRQLTAIDVLPKRPKILDMYQLFIKRGMKWTKEGAGPGTESKSERSLGATLSQNNNQLNHNSTEGEKMCEITSAMVRNGGRKATKDKVPPKNKQKTETTTEAKQSKKATKADPKVDMYQQFKGGIKWTKEGAGPGTESKSERSLGATLSQNNNQLNHNSTEEEKMCEITSAMVRNGGRKAPKDKVPPKNKQNTETTTEAKQSKKATKADPKVDIYIQFKRGIKWTKEGAGPGTESETTTETKQSKIDTKAEKKQKKLERRQMLKAERLAMSQSLNSKWKDTEEDVGKRSVWSAVKEALLESRRMRNLDKNQQVAYLYTMGEELVTDQDIEHISKNLIELIRQNGSMTEVANQRKYDGCGRGHGGWLVVTCSNQETLEWTLKQNIPPTLSGRQFKSVRFRNLPGPLELMFHFTRSSNNIEENLLKMLQRENDDVKDIDKWKFLVEKEMGVEVIKRNSCIRNYHCTLLLSAPRTSLEDLHRKKWQVTLGSTQWALCRLDDCQ